MRVSVQREKLARGFWPGNSFYPSRTLFFFSSEHGGSVWCGFTSLRARLFFLKKKKKNKNKKKNFKAWDFPGGPKELFLGRLCAPKTKGLGSIPH